MSVRARGPLRTLRIGESGESLLLPSTRPRVVGDNGAAGIGSVTRRCGYLKARDRATRVWRG